MVLSFTKYPIPTGEVWRWAYLAMVGYFPPEQDFDAVWSLLAWALGVLAPRSGGQTLFMVDINANPGWAAGFRKALAAIMAIWEDFFWDTGTTGLSRCTPRREYPTWVDGCGCVGMIDHVLLGGGPAAGTLKVDAASLFPSDRRPVVWDAPGVVQEETRPAIRQPRGFCGVHFASCEGPPPPRRPREWDELPGRVDQVQQQLQTHAQRWPRWWETLDNLWSMLKLRRDLVHSWEVGNLQRYLAHLPEVAHFSQPSRNAFRCLYRPARAPPVQPRFSVAVDVASRVQANGAPD